MELLDLAEAASLVQVSTQTLRNYSRAGRLAEHKDGKRIQVSRADLETLFSVREATQWPDATRVFAVCNHKGGVGKTTTAATLGYCFGERGRTLLIDADPQAHLTQVFGVDSDKLEKTLYEVLVDGYPIVDVSRPLFDAPPLGPRSAGAANGARRLYLVGSNLELAQTTLQVTGQPWWANLLRNALKPALQNFDYVIIDCPPTLDALTVNAIAAATDIIVPVDMGAFSLRGTVKLLEMIRHVAEEMAKPPSYRFLACRVEPNQFSDDVLDQLWRHYGTSVYCTVIRKAVDVGRAQMYRQPLPVMFPTNPATIDYNTLAKEILDA